jgi:hypothetical protein
MVKAPFTFLPLYVYPMNSSSWDTLTASIAANSALDFRLIVAPDLSNVLPDSNYIASLSTLNSFSNVQTLGYVPTNYTTRDISDVLTDVDSYAAWLDYAEADIGVSGIFFDEIPSTLSTDASSYLNNITSFARNALGPKKSLIAFNPGVPVDEKYYTMADIINVFENSWDLFNLTTLDLADSDLLEKYISPGIPVLLSLLPRAVK